MNTSNNKRIVKNTVMLYFRMLITMVVALYTSRVVLQVLGVEDYGLYNVVAGFVTMFGFLNTAMTAASQRFLAYEIGQEQQSQLRKVFSMSLNIHILITLIILVFAETAGLWFVNTQLSIPEGRMPAVRWVYQFSILSLIVNMISVPYNALIIAQERMGVFAWISIIEVTLKLLMVFVLQWVGIDKLKLYAVLTFGVSLTTCMMYIVYCHGKFKDSRYKFLWDNSLFKSLTNFSFWSIWGSLSWVMMGQGLNVLLNIFFGPVVNASRGIAFQVNAIVVSFMNNIRVAVNPQVIKSYSSGDTDHMNKLAIESAKYSFYLLLLLSLPIFLEIETVMKLWLNIVPPYAALFCQLILINSMIHTCDISVVFSARGRIKENQFFGGLIYILVLPVSYIFLKLGYQPESVFYIQIAATLVVDFGVNIYLLRKIADIRLSRYLKELIIPVTKVTILAGIIPVLIALTMEKSVLRMILIVVISTISIIISVYFAGVNDSVRILIKQRIFKSFRR